jgi:predicted metalloprotease with PDZ domain
MLDFLKICKSEKRNIDFALFNQVISKYIGKNIGPDTKMYIEKGEFIPFEKLDTLMPNTFVNSEEKIFEIGFKTDIGKIKKGAIINSFLPSSQALEAGLNIGDKIAGLNYVIDDYNYKCKIKIERNNEIKEISYYPFIKTNLPQIKPENTFIKNTKS